ncbi:MAG: 3D domain-containing protein [Verrucomicrobia bacterium]|nr:3D domain-containing protein [Verrucomicrobiota bacterium]
MKLSPVFLPGILVLLAGCAQPVVPLLGGAPQPGKIYRVKTTAYTGKRNGIGKPLQHGPVTSAAADWSEFPLGTRFRLVESGKCYIIDDYGSAMVGTRTIDLCMPSTRAMNAWGVRTVNIEIQEWGSSRRSLEVLAPRERVRYVRRMTTSLRRQSQGIPKKFHKVE